MFNRFLLDRYILWTFAKLVIVGFVSFAGLYVVIDSMNNLDELLAHAKTVKGGVPRVLTEFYGPRLLDLFDRTAGLLAMVAAMLSVTMLQRNQELTAMLAAGISKFRVAIPLLGGALVLSILGTVNREVWLPHARERLAYLAQDLDGKMGRTVIPAFDHRTDLMFSGAKAYPKLRRIDSPQIRLPVDFATWGKKIQAAQAELLPADANHPEGYLLSEVSLPSDLPQLPSATFEEEPILLSPHDHPWLQPQQCFVVTELPFESLTGNTSYRRYLSTPELIAGLHNRSLRYGADVKVLLHHRFLAPLLDAIMLLVGLALVLGREQRNIFLAAGVCLAIVGALLVVITASHAAGANYLLRPALAAWLPLVIFAPIAYALVRPLCD